MKVAVSGINGFLGNYLKEELINSGHVLVPIGTEYGHDITQIDTLGDIPEFEVLVHLAAASYVPDAYIKPQHFYNTNVMGTLNMLELVRKNQAKIVYISSYVYGEPDYQPIDEKHLVKPFNPYAQSKVMAEELCLAYYRDFKLAYTILRPFNIYGFGQANHFLIPKLVSQYIHDDEVTIFDPRPKRDYLHVTDVAKAIVKTVDSNFRDGEIINIGYGNSYSIPDICSLLQDITGRSLEVKVLNQFRPSEILDTVCDNSLANKLLNWKPAVSLKDGLKDMVNNLTVN